jgi:AcrR family transcriptional regulator
MASDPAPVEHRLETSVRARQRADTRARLVRAAKEVFEEKGFQEARVSDIAERAGVAKGLLYYYFDTKQAIFREVAAEVDRELAHAIDVMLDPSSGVTPADRLRNAIRVHLETYRNDARMMKVIEDGARYDEVVNEARDALHRMETERLTRAVRQLQLRGLADPRLDPEVAAVVLGAMTWRFAERWLARGDLECEFDVGVEQFTLMVLNSLRVEDGA